MTKRPAFQFYPGDWLRSTDLRLCSVGARGLWIDMICFMHEGNPYGHLKVGDKVILPVNLASMVGADLEKVVDWLGELEKAGVFSLKNDCIVSRRMIRDERIRESRAKGGKLGGNPMLIAQGKVNLDANLELTPAVAVASASSRSKTRSTPVASRDAPVNGAPVAHIPIIGGEFAVSAELLKELEAAYPQVDGPATLKQIRAWCVTNPEKRKTAKGIPRFLNRWFEKDQNRG